MKWFVIDIVLLTLVLGALAWIFPLAELVGLQN